MLSFAKWMMMLCPVLALECTHSYPTARDLEAGIVSDLFILKGAFFIFHHRYWILFSVTRKHQEIASDPENPRISDHSVVLGEVDYCTSDEAADESEHRNVDQFQYSLFPDIPEDVEDQQRLFVQISDTEWWVIPSFRIGGVSFETQSNY